MARYRLAVAPSLLGLGSSFSGGPRSRPLHDAKYRYPLTTGCGGRNADYADGHEPTSALSASDRIAEGADRHGNASSALHCERRSLQGRGWSSDIDTPGKWYLSMRICINLFQWSECAGTSRWGIKDEVDKSEWMLGINNWQGCDGAIDGHQYEDKGDSINSDTISDLCYRILAPGYAQDWQTFATTGTDRKSLQSKDWVKYLSLEYIHNNLHVGSHWKFSGCC